LAYIGNIPAESYASFETETFSVSATTNYTLSHAVTNENEIRLVINGVVQQPGSGKAYTASGTTLTLTSATVSGDVMYAVYLGRALQTVNPPNASVGSAQIADSSVTSAKLSGVTQGISMIDQFNLTADHSGNGDVTANIARANHVGFGRIGTGMTESSGVFSFPSTGIYLVIAKAVFRTDSDGDRTMELYTKVTTNNSSYTTVDSTLAGDQNSTSATNNTACSFVLVDVTDITQVKVKFTTGSVDQTLEGSEDTPNYNLTTFTFVRIGDT